MKTAASAPASSANLGPGFDVLALALGLRCRVEVERAAAWEVESPAGHDGRSLVEEAAAGTGVGPLRVTIGGNVPIARGLGSSAALIVATIAAARAIGGAEVDRAGVLSEAAGVEGHPDNVAAAVYGGLVAVGPFGTVRRLEIHESLLVLVGVPAETLSTAAARRVTADPVPSAVAARTAARLAFLVEGLRTGDPALLAEAAGDELHEGRRARLSPLTGSLVDAARRAGARHAAWSGAGPAAVAFVTDHEAEAVTAAWRELLEPGGGEVLRPGVDRIGLVVETD